MSSEKQAPANNHDHDLFGSISITDNTGKKVAEDQPHTKKRRPMKARDEKQKRSPFMTLIISLVLIISTYLLAGFFLVPYLITTIFAERISDKLQVELTIAAARFNPLTFQVELANLSIETIDRSFEPSLFTAQNLESTLNILALLRGDWVCSQLTLSGSKLTIIRNEAKKYNISALLQRDSAEQHSEIIDFAELPLLFSLNNISISDGTIVFIDKVTDKRHLISDIALSLPTVSNVAYQTDTYLQPRFSAVINGSPVLLTGEPPAEPGGNIRETVLSCALDRFDLGFYFDYLPVALPVLIKNGLVNGNLRIAFSSENQLATTLMIQLNLAIQNLELSSKNEQLSLQVPAVRIEGSIEPFAQKLLLSTVLFREPQITLDEKFSSETLTSLAAFARRPAPDDPRFQVIPEIGIQLLIADNATLYRKSNRLHTGVKTWQALQLTLKNFNNHVEVQDKQEQSSFRLSGEQAGTAGFFNWQGTINARNQPVGTIQLNNIPLKTIAPFLAPSAKEIEGTAELSGLLELSLEENDTLPFDYTLKDTRVTVKDLRLRDHGLEWLLVPVLECNPVNRINGMLDLGSVTMANGRAQFLRSRLPKLFSSFHTPPGQQLLHGVAFSGTVLIHEAGSPAPIVTFSDTVFKANNLHLQTVQDNNFSFSATVNQTGSIRSQGTLSLTPVTLETTLTFTKVYPRQLFTWFSSDPSLIGSAGTVSGSGRFSYPQPEFSGALEANNLVIGQAQQPVLASKQVVFEDFNWSLNSQSLSIDTIVLNQPELSWQRDQGESSTILSASVFLRHVFLPEPLDFSPDPDIDRAKFTLMIERIDFEDGALSYRDFRTSTPLALGLTGLNGSLSSLEYPVIKQPSRLVLSGNIEGSPFTIKGTADLMQDPPAAQYVFTAQALPLSLFAEQLTAQIPGINIADGTAAITVQEQLDSGQHSSQVSLLIDRLTPKKNTTPVAVAIALISGNSDQLSIALSAEGEDRSQPLLAMLINDFNKNVIKATINPFLIGDPTFSDLVDRHDISFPPNSTELDPRALEQLSRISEFLASHPRLKLHIAGFADLAHDQTALQSALEQIERQRIDEQNKKRLAEWQRRQNEKEMLAAQAESSTEQSFTESDITDQELPPFVPLTPQKVSVSKAQLEALASRRAAMVRQTLSQSLAVPPERITIVKQPASVLSHLPNNQVRLWLEAMFEVDQ